MPVEFVCACGTKVEVPDKFAQSKVNCPICKRTTAISEVKPTPWWEDHQKSIERVIVGRQPERPKPGERSECRTERSEESPEAFEADKSEEALEGLEGIHGLTEEDHYGMKRKRLSTSGTKAVLVSLLILAAGLVLVFLVMGPTIHRVDRRGGFGEVHHIVPAPEEPSATEQADISVRENLRYREDLSIPSPIGEFDRGRGTIVSSSGEPLVLREKSPAIHPNVEIMEGQAVEEREKKLLPLEGEAGLIRQSQTPGKAYTVNVGSFRKKGRADRYVEDLREKGFEAFHWEVELPHKGRWHHVSIGKFTTRIEAQLFPKDLGKKGLETFVAKLQKGQRPAALSESSPGKQPEIQGQDDTPPKIQDLRRLLRS